MQDLLETLDVDNPQVADELRALKSIYGDVAVSIKQSNGVRAGSSGIQLQLNTSLPSHEHVGIALNIRLPHSYPTTTPPQIQLLGKYIGDFAIDSDLFGQVTRTYMHEDTWQAGDVAIFDGVESIRESCERFFDMKSDELAAKELSNPHSAFVDAANEHMTSHQPDSGSIEVRTTRIELPPGCTVYSSEAIVDRKSVFIGHACQIDKPEQVHSVTAWLLQDRKIARAAHPAMLAYRCKGDNGVIYQDNDDDGESAAGSRLAHLLQVLDLHNVLVIVTRWYGGIHLGSDRFKHINQAARDALAKGHLLNLSANSKQRS